MRLLRPVLAVYGAGIAAWLFIALSGASACAAGFGACRAVFGLIGQFALVWPAYWGVRLSGEAVLRPLLTGEVIFAALFAFAAVVGFAKAKVLLGTAAAEDEGEAFEEEIPGRRNQSVLPPAI